MFAYLLMQTVVWSVAFLWFYGPDDPTERFTITRGQWIAALAFMGAQGLLALALLITKGLA